MYDKESSISRSYLIPGNCWPSELNFIYDTCLHRNSYIEVGVFCGKSLFCASMALAPGAIIYLIDNGLDYSSMPSRDWWMDTLNATIKAISQIRPDITINTQYMFKNSSDALQAMATDKVRSEVIYIDACHEYAECKADIQLARHVLDINMIRPILFGHDYTHRHPGVMDAVNECLKFKQVASTRFWLMESYLNIYDS